MKLTGICIIAPRPSDSGGISRWCSIYTSYLEKNGIKYYLLDTTPTISNQKRNNILKRIATSIPLANKIARQLKALIKQNRIDCVHIATSASLSLFRDKKLIRICNKHNIDVLYHYHFGTFNKIINSNSWEAKLLIKNSNKCFKTICIDEQTYNLAKHNVDNAVLIYNPVILEQYEPNYAAKRIVFAGHVRDNKGINELLVAWDRLYSKHKDWELCICGKLLFDFVEKAKDPQNVDKRIVFTDHVSFDTLQKIMSGSSIFTLPSYFEGCPNVILEAMSHSMAIVATEVGAIPETINGCGTLIKIKDVDSLANALEAYMESEQKRREDGERARLKVLKYYSSDLICSKYVNLFGDKK